MSNMKLAFIWHMHQPYYRDMVTGESTMPWVRLHGIHSYYDMLRLHRKYPSIRGTINFVPSLVKQIREYVEEGKADTFLEHTLVPAETLTREQKVFILRHFFMANPERKIEPYGPYHKLYARMGGGSTKVDYSQAVRFFSNQDYLDLQVYYNLVWFGFSAKEEMPRLTEMLHGGGHFTEEDKRFVIDSQMEILKKLLEELRVASASENVEISTTPFYHPILPLVIDTGIAHRSNPKAHLPPLLTAPHMARMQVGSALAAMEEWTGRKPRGMWPAEGGVAPEIIPMVVDAGVEWIATDGDILDRSLPKDKKRINRFQPFLVSHEGKEVAAVFRDHALSDLIGFTYGKMSAEDAIADFVGHLKTIDKGTKGERCLVTVILDGENPWEFYHESGREFLNGLFQAFEREGIATTTVGDAVRSEPPTEKIDHLYSGSWISANFNIWIGKPQANQAWDYIRRTLEDTGEALRSDDPKSALAYQSLSAACGSDWFWWFDDDFSSAFKGDFDRIFRTHLKNAYTSVGQEIPLFLFDPIYRFEEAESILEPPGWIEPTVDGTESSFFEWTNASVMTVHGHSSGAMAMNSTDPFETISFGFNEDKFYIRIDPIDRSNGFALGEDDAIRIGIHANKRHSKFIVRIDGGTAIIKALAKDGTESECEFARCGAHDVLETGFEFAPLGLAAGDDVTLTITLTRKGIEIRRYSHIHFIVPDETYALRMWSV